MVQNLETKHGDSGIDVTHSLNLEDVNDPSNFQIKRSGSQIYDKLLLKANSADVYTKTYVNEQLNLKLNSFEISNYYTKWDSNNLLVLKQNALSNLSGDGIELLSTNGIRTNW